MADGAAIFMGVFGIFIGLFYLIMFAAAILGTILWVFMLIDAIKRDYPKPDDKIIWVLVIAIVGVIGAVIYYFVVKKQDKKVVKK